jgi:hypothetical protein
MGTKLPRELQIQTRAKEIVDGTLEIYMTRQFGWPGTKRHSRMKILV